MKVIIKRPCDQFGEEATIPNTLKALQEAVGGYIETTPTCLSGLVMVVNEEGKLMGLPFNNTATDLARGLYESIVGNAVIMEVKGSELAPLELADLGKIAAFAASSNIRTRPMETEEDDE